MAKKKDRADFVMVRLSAAGVKAAAGALHFSNRHMEYSFTPGEAQEVIRRYEWDRVLSTMQIDGEPLFEIAEEGDKGETNGSI